jgi:WD40 repeat protein
MRYRHAIPGLALALSILLAGSPAHATPAASAGDSWRVVDEQVIDIEGAPLRLSPDGAWIAGTGPNDDFCIWDVETLEPTCDGEALAGIIPRSVTWSPDSTAVAFSLDAPRMLRDSDVYVFETETGTVENLTEDDPDGTGADDIGFGDDAATGPVPIDLYPSWSPDSQELVFARTMWSLDDGDPGTSLMTIPREGGEPEELLVLAPPTPMIVNGPMTWQDDDAILFGIRKADLDDGQNGIWRTSLDGGLEQVLRGTAQSDVPTPMLTDVSGDGAGASVMSMANYAQFGASEDVYFALDLDGGEVMPWNDVLGLDTGGDARLYTPPVFSPDDMSVAFTTMTEDGNIHISIATDLGVSQSIITFEKDARPSYPPSLAEPRIDWVADDTMLVITHLGVAVLTLEQSGEATPVPPCGCTPPPGAVRT